MPPAELVERLGDLGHLRRDNVVPDLAFFGADRFGDRAVGVDGVAAVNEKVRAPLAHRLVDLHAAKAGVDAPALAGRVTAPQKTQIGARVSAPPALVVQSVWRNDKPADRRLANRAI